MNETLSVIILGCVLGIILCLFTMREDTMKVCELSHSHDVCFTALNR